MLLSEFPREIIEQLIELLPLKDKISCSLVCKSWKELFQDSLHSDLVLDRSLLEGILNHPQDHQPSLLATRLLVRHLKVNYNTLTTDEELYALQQTFPNIKYLYFEPKSLISENFGATADWNIWRLLRELQICLYLKHEPDIESTLVRIALCLPLLRRLKIHNTNSEVQLSFSLDDFEAIHSHLNYLTDMQLSSDLLTLSKTDLERMTRVSPAANMSSLKISTENTDHRWLCYFARKYPNLRTLNLDISNTLPNINEKKSNTTSLFQQVPLPFQHLTRLCIEYSDWTAKNHLLFYDLTHFHNVPLKSICVTINMLYEGDPPHNPWEFPTHITEVSLAAFSKTIESFTLFFPSKYSTTIDLAELKDSLYNLVELMITSSTSVEIDTLLCAAPRLRKVHLENSDIELEGELYTSNRFVLQSFTVVWTTMTSDVLRFLSFHCRSLNELILEITSVHGSFTTPGCQFIDMAYTRLDKFNMETSFFIIQDNEESPENLNITLITRPIDDIPPKQDYDPNVLPVIVGCPPSKSRNAWFYTDNPYTKWDISEEQGSRVEKFVLNYEENKKITGKRTLDPKERKLNVFSDDNFCKSWKELFQDSLHSDLVVNRSLLENILNPPQDNQPPCLKTRLLVRYLEIRYNTLATDEELYVLQQTFPNIKYLYFEPKSLITDNFGATADWNIWRALRELQLSLDQKHEPDIENKLVKSTLCLPLLRRLNIHNTNIRLQLSFSLDDFETIHSHLNHLGHLKLNLDLLTLSEADIERMSKVSPATKMGSLDMATKNTDSRWLFYFARKYPNLRTLKLCTSHTPSDRNRQESTTTLLFQQVPLPFQHLTKLNVTYCRWTEKDYIPFLDITHFHNVPLKDLSVTINFPYRTLPENPCYVSKHITKVCLAEFSKTIESYHLRCPNTFTVPIDLAEIKDSFYNLVELKITHTTSVEIDTLLCAAPRLRTVHLESSDIKLKGGLYTSNRFGLQMLRLWQAELTSDVLRFLSFHCRSLDELDLQVASVYGSFTTPGCQFINMTYTCLERLYIVDTQFVIQDNKKCPENLNIALITRPLENIPPKQDYDPNILPIVDEGSSVEIYYEWFYTNSEKEMMLISAERGSHVQNFVKNYEENKRITLQRGDLDANKQKPHVGWNNNCVFGYTEIKLGYVFNYHFHYARDYRDFYPDF
ncbi:hypothetical protein CLU79DRAFT_887078 [Phycomyces nitens]|nr:hypothetical protein CLU79DRAFT_887078 [Phycomyces nitens]